MKAFWTIALLFTLSAEARENPAACRTQIALFCEDEQTRNDAREILKCLVKNDERLSTECKQEVQRLVQAARQTTPPGGGPLGALGSLTGLGSQVPSLTYSGLHSPTPHDSTTPAITENHLVLSTPIFKTESDTVAVSVNGSELRLGEPIPLDSGRVVPANLYRTEAGLQYSHRLSGRRMVGARGSFGYAGDDMNNDTRSFSVSANYSYPSANENGRWVLMVMMSNNSPLGTFVPIPGFFYIYRTDRFTGVFGIPIFSMQWTPIHPWSFSLSAFGPLVKSEAAYGAIDKLQGFVALAWRQQRYILSDRTDKDERLTIEEKDLEAGARRPLLTGLHSEFLLGYSFNRSVYLGEGLFNKKGGDAGLDPNWYLKWMLKFVF